MGAPVLARDEWMIAGSAKLLQTMALVTVAGAALTGHLWVIPVAGATFGLSSQWWRVLEWQLPPWLDSVAYVALSTSIGTVLATTLELTSLTPRLRAAVTMLVAPQRLTILIGVLFGALAVILALRGLALLAQIAICSKAMTLILLGFALVFARAPELVSLLTLAGLITFFGLLAEAVGATMGATSTAATAAGP